VRTLRSLSNRRRMVAGIVVVLAVGGGGVAWAMNRPSGSNGSPTSSVATVTTTTLRQSVSTSGTIEPATQSNLSFTVSGTVTSVSAVVGAKVAKGAVLASVDPTDLQAAVDSAQANVDAAKDQVDAAAGSTDTQVAAANAQLAAAESRLATARQDLADAKLRSPIAGTVAEVNVAVGDQVSGGGGNSSGNSSGNGSGSSAQIVVIATDKWVVDASVSSADLAQIKKGLQVEITPTDTTTKVFGIVTSVGVVANSSSGTATFPVTIAVTGSPSGLYAGGTASVSIITKQIPNALTVPTIAVRTVGGKTVVTRRTNGTDVTTEVKIGAVLGGSTQILSGLNDGDEVVVESPRFGGSTSGNNRQRQRTGETGFGGPGNLVVPGGGGTVVGGPGGSLQLNQGGN